MISVTVLPACDASASAFRQRVSRRVGSSRRIDVPSRASTAFAYLTLTPAAAATVDASRLGSASRASIAARTFMSTSICAGEPAPCCSSMEFASARAIKIERPLRSVVQGRLWRHAQRFPPPHERIQPRRVTPGVDEVVQRARLDNLLARALSGAVLPDGTALRVAETFRQPRARAQAPLRPLRIQLMVDWASVHPDCCVPEANRAASHSSRRCRGRRSGPAKRRSIGRPSPNLPG